MCRNCVEFLHHNNLPKISTIFRVSLSFLPQAVFHCCYSAFAEAPSSADRAPDLATRFRQKQACKQKALRLLTSLLVVSDSCSEEPGCFPFLFVCSLFQLFPSRDPVWNRYLIWLTHDWSYLQTFKERCYRGNFVRVSGDSPTIFRRSWSLSEPVR